MADIDLEKADPGKMFAAAENAKDYTFLLVANKPNFTNRAFEQNPNCATGADLLFKSPMLPDDKGKVALDLKSHAKSIKDKLKEAETKALAVVIASSKPTNQDPKKRMAVIEQVTLHKNAASIKLNGIKTSVSMQDWIAYHHAILFVEMIAKDVPQVTFELDPKTPWFNSPIMVCGVWEPVAPGKIEIKRMIMGGIGNQHPPNPKCKFAPGVHDGWWPLWSTQINRKHGPITFSLSRGVENYIFGLYARHAGQFVFTVKGTGPHAKLVEKINLSFNGQHKCPGD